MPFITVTAEPPPGSTARACTHIARTVAEALGLPPGGAFAQHVSAAAACDGDGHTTRFVVVDIYGRSRPENARSAATAALRTSVAELWECPADNVHVQWHTVASDSP